LRWFDSVKEKVHAKTPSRKVKNFFTAVSEAFSSQLTKAHRQRISFASLRLRGFA